MHRGSYGSEDLGPFDPEIEVTFWVRQCCARNLSKEANQVQEAIMDPATTPFRDFAMPDPNSIAFSIMRPLIEGATFNSIQGLSLFSIRAIWRMSLGEPQYSYLVTFGEL